MNTFRLRTLALPLLATLALLTTPMVDAKGSSSSFGSFGGSRSSSSSSYSSPSKSSSSSYSSPSRSSSYSAPAPSRPSTYSSPSPSKSESSKSSNSSFGSFGSASSSSKPSAPPTVAPTQTPSSAFLRDATANRAKEQSAQTYRNAAAAAAVGTAGAVAVHEATKPRAEPTPQPSTSVARAPAQAPTPPTPPAAPVPSRSGSGFGDVLTGVLIGNAISNHGHAQERSTVPSSGSYSTPTPIDPDSELGRTAQSVDAALAQANAATARATPTDFQTRMSDTSDSLLGLFPILLGITVLMFLFALGFKMYRSHAPASLPSKKSTRSNNYKL